MENLCGSCVFFEKTEGDRGLCHYFPPTGEAGFAHTSERSWCSRYRVTFPLFPDLAEDHGGKKKRE
jgi:hypothetical protein